MGWIIAMANPTLAYFGQIYQRTLYKIVESLNPERSNSSN